MFKRLAGSQMFQRSGYARGIFRLYRFRLCRYRSVLDRKRHEGIHRTDGNLDRGLYLKRHPGAGKSGLTFTKFRALIKLQFFKKFRKENHMDSCDSNGRSRRDGQNQNYEFQPCVPDCWSAAGSFLSVNRAVWQHISACFNRLVIQC